MQVLCRNIKHLLLLVLTQNKKKTIFSTKLLCLLYSNEYRASSCLQTSLKSRHSYLNPFLTDRLSTNGGKDHDSITERRIVFLTSLHYWRSKKPHKTCAWTQDVSWLFYHTGPLRCAFCNTRKCVDGKYFTRASSFLHDLPSKLWLGLLIPRMDTILVVTYSTLKNYNRPPVRQVNRQTPCENQQN